MASTKSELLFLQICEISGWTVDKIPETHDRRPDFILKIGDQEIIVEIKQSEASEDDQLKVDNAQSGELILCSFTIGDYVRGKLGDAVNQILSYGRNDLPSMIVFYNDRDFLLGDRVCPDSIQAAMYGNDAIVFTNPNSLNEPVVPIARTLSNNGRMQHDRMIAISAVSLITLIGEEYKLEVYHNEYARVPINRDVLRKSHIEQFTIYDGRADQWPEWVAV